jgi:RNA polymerase sigma-70 factor (ECF subfamily)
VNVDERLMITRAQGGDPAAFEALVNQHARYVFNLALRVVHDPQEAENLSQEAFLRAWRALPGFRAEASFTTWLYQIVTRLCYNRLPRLRMELAALDPDADEIKVDLKDERLSLEDTLLSEELQRTLHQAIDRLPDGFRLLITLRHLQGLSYAEIAAVTGLPLGTVKTGIHRARQQLRQHLEVYEAAYG